ncbi:MAG TPA: HEPN domain-containing protein [Bacillota bacterium]|nr:HEPN domain-containing protein [Bacillota bacterium]
MNQQEQYEYANNRLDRAKQILDDARLLIENGSILSANNRIYYAVFNAICAVLIFNDLVNKNHTQVIGSFNKLIINTGILDRKYGRFIHDVKNIREKSDYSFEETDESETQENYDIAVDFLEQIDELVLKIKEGSLNFLKE